MKKVNLFLLVAITIVGFSFMSCATPVEETQEPAPVIGAEGFPMPEWVNSVPRVADLHYETGYAKLSSKANSMQRANAAAKEKISQWINTTVQSVIVNYTSDSGSGDNRQSLEVFESISRQIANNSLVGVTQEALWVDQDGGVWILASIPIENTLQAFESAEESFNINEAAVFADFKMNEALDMLEKSLTSE